MKTLILISLLFLISCHKETPEPCTYGKTQYPDAPWPYNNHQKDDKVVVALPEGGAGYIRYVYNCINNKRVDIIYEREHNTDCWPEPRIEYDVCQ